MSMRESCLHRKQLHQPHQNGLKNILHTFTKNFLENHKTHKKIIFATFN